MEYLMFFEHNVSKKYIEMHSIDPEAIVHFLRNKDFRFTAISAYKYRSTDEIEHVEPRRDEEATWAYKNKGKEHALIISGFLETCSYQDVVEVMVEFKDGCSICYLAGQLWVYYQNKAQIEEDALFVLRSYGFFGAKKIWDFVTQHSHAFPIDPLVGHAPEQITDKELQFILKLALNIEKEHRKFDELDAQEERE